ncbi:hypothetical protein B0H13DRAFT_2418447, partial [Mycena leptocephala]
INICDTLSRAVTKVDTLGTVVPSWLVTPIYSSIMSNSYLLPISSKPPFLPDSAQLSILDSIDAFASQYALQAPSFTEEVSWLTVMKVPRTPYKSSKSFFTNMASTSGITLAKRPRAVLDAEPNILFNLATVGPPGQVGKAFIQKFGNLTLHLPPAFGLRAPYLKGISLQGRQVTLVRISSTMARLAADGAVKGLANAHAKLPCTHEYVSSGTPHSGHVAAVPATCLRSDNMAADRDDLKRNVIPAKQFVSKYVGTHESPTPSSCAAAPASVLPSSSISTLQHYKVHLPPSSSYAQKTSSLHGDGTIGKRRPSTKGVEQKEDMSTEHAIRERTIRGARGQSKVRAGRPARSLRWGTTERDLKASIAVGQRNGEVNITGTASAKRQTFTLAKIYANHLSLAESHPTPLRQPHVDVCVGRERLELNLAVIAQPVVILQERLQQDKSQAAAAAHPECLAAEDNANQHSSVSALRARGVTSDNGQALAVFADLWQWARRTLEGRPDMMRKGHETTHASVSEKQEKEGSSNAPSVFLPSVSVPSAKPEKKDGIRVENEKLDKATALYAWSTHEKPCATEAERERINDTAVDELEMTCPQVQGSVSPATHAGRETRTFENPPDADSVVLSSSEHDSRVSIFSSARDAAVDTTLEDSTVIELATHCKNIPSASADQNVDVSLTNHSENSDSTNGQFNAPAHKTCTSEGTEHSESHPRDPSAMPAITLEMDAEERAVHVESGGLMRYLTIAHLNLYPLRLPVYSCASVKVEDTTPKGIATPCESLSAAPQLLEEESCRIHTPPITQSSLRMRKNQFIANMGHGALDLQAHPPATKVQCVSSACTQVAEAEGLEKKAQFEV